MNSPGKDRDAQAADALCNAEDAHSEQKQEAAKQPEEDKASVDS